MLKWPQVDSCKPKVLLISRLPPQIFNPQPQRPPPASQNHPHCISKGWFPPTCPFPQPSIRSFLLYYLRSKNQTPPRLQASKHFSMELLPYGLLSALALKQIVCYLYDSFFLQQVYILFLLIFYSFCPDCLRHSNDHFTVGKHFFEYS